MVHTLPLHPGVGALAAHDANSRPMSRTSVTPMPVSATFVPDSIDVASGTPTVLTLQLHNSDDQPQAVQLAPTGDLAEHLALAVATAHVEPNQTLDVPVTISIGPAVEAGERMPGVMLTWPGGTATASLRAVVAATTDHSVGLRPLRSRGSRGGRHTIKVVNSGNAPLRVDISPDALDGEIALDVQPTLAVAPGATAQTTLRVTPATTYRNGPAREHAFVITTRSSDGTDAELAGTYEQRPRIPRWLGPAAAGAAAALVIGTAAWFALAKPWVEDTAQDAVDDDRVALRERIAELEAAAADAKELPLGAPTDVRLSVAPSSGNTASDTYSVDSGVKLSVTDVIFQNPTGAVGTVSLMRDDEIVLQSELANFRDFDLHLVAPFVFDEATEVVLEVDCGTPGPGASDCPVAATLLGFVDEIR